MFNRDIKHACARFHRTLGSAFPDVRAGCVYHYTRPSLMQRLARFFRRIL